MVPVGLEPRVVEVYVGFNIWVDPVQGFYWVDGFEPTFATPQEARNFALTQVPPVFAPTGNGGSVLPFAAILAAASLIL